MPTYTVKLHLRSYHTDEKFDLQDFQSKEISAKDLDEVFTLLDDFDPSFYQSIDDSSVINHDENAELEEVNVEYIEIKDDQEKIVYEDNIRTE
jgi:hypothetical protein|tara:strand:- start:278 stop:556 length:279 start_codon:yes stop_codon:yes gene_type:complete